MGSTGTGHLTDYSNYRGARVGVTGGKDLVNMCEKAFETSIEDVETNDYYISKGSVPPAGARGVLSFNGKRIVVVDDSGKTIGNMPTTYNYLLNCLEEGYEYVWVVVASAEKPLPSVVIAIAPNKKP
ncbi:MAG: hypothetical protein II825_01035 [Paludibacteraceae bacterium]|nr:hypothetical protein [Paludibacteraceae bacterium]